MGNNKTMYEPSMKKRKLLEKITLHIKSDQDDDDVESTNKANIEYIKQDLKEVIEYNNTTTYHPDGTIVITPHYFENLPNEILANILDYLSPLLDDDQDLVQTNHYQLCLVNKQFYQHVNRLLWHTPFLYGNEQIERFITCLTNTQVIQRSTTPSDGCQQHHTTILTAKHHVRRLHIDDDYWDNVRLTIAMTCLNLLERLDIANAKITDAVLPYLPRYCPYLTTLLLPDGMINQLSCLDAITAHCYQLRHLEFYIDHILQLQQIRIFDALLQCPSLTILRLHSGDDDDCDDSHLDEYMIKNLTKLHQLTTMAFLGDAMTPTTELVFNTVDMTTVWPRLSSLTIDGGEFLTDTMMIPFIQSHPHIQSLDLTDTRISDATLDNIATHLPHITHVRIVGNPTITSEGVYHLIRHCHDLQQVDFSNCTHLLHSMIEFSGFYKFDDAVLTLEQMKKIRQRDIN